MMGAAKPPEGAGDPPLAAEDTVEFELTAEQQVELWKAAGALGPASEQSALPQLGSPGYDTYICRRTDRVDRLGTIAFATVVLALTVASGWRSVGVSPPPATRVVKVTTAPAVAAPVPPQPAVVQVLNPFDATEVFELPANTTESGARDAIAKLLLQRARERMRQGFDVHRIANRPVHATASSPLDVFVTRLSSAEDRLGGMAGLTAEAPDQGVFARR